MSYEVWGEPDDGPELPEGCLNEEDAQELRDRITALEAQLAARATPADHSRDATPIVDSAQVAFKGTITVFGDGTRNYQFIEPVPNLKHGEYEVTCLIAASAREKT